MRFKLVLWALVFFVCIFSVSAMWCYQETATSNTSCGGLSGGSYPDHGAYVGWRDGVWGDLGINFDYNDSYRVNYQVPVNYSGASSVWQLYYGHASGFVTENVTIPAFCIAGRSFLNLSIDFYNSGTSMNFSCYDGSSWNVLRSYSGTLGGLGIGEEAVWWYYPTVYNVSFNANAEVDGSYIYGRSNVFVNVSVNDTNYSASRIFLYSTGLSSYCYQESAHVSSSCGIVGTGYYTGNSGFNDANWSSYGVIYNFSYPNINTSGNYLQVKYATYSCVSDALSCNATYLLNRAVTSNISLSSCGVGSAYVFTSSTYTTKDSRYRVIYCNGVSLFEYKEGIAGSGVCGGSQCNGVFYEEGLYHNVSYYSGDGLSYNFSSLSDGKYYFNASVFDQYYAYSSSNTRTVYIVNNNFTVYPDSYSLVENVNTSTSFPIYITTNSLDVPLNFTVSCSASANIVCLANNLSNIVNNGSVLVNVSNNASVGTYYANITISRSIDGRSIIVPLIIGVENIVGVPTIVNLSNWENLMYSDELDSYSWTLYNNGTYNLSNCSLSLSGSLSGVSFAYVSGLFNVSIVPNASQDVTLYYSSPNVGLYSGYVDISCISTASGLFSSLNPSNRPFLQLVSIARPVNGGGGGGGGSVYIPPVVSDADDTFRLETDAGGSSSALYFYPGQSRDLSIVVTSLITTDQDISLKCDGTFCSNVVFSDSGVGLSGKSFDVVLVNIKVPKNAVYGSSYTFSIVGTDDYGRTKKLDVQIQVSKVASFVDKFSLITKPGDEGYLLTLGGVNVPKLVFYIVVIGLFEVMLAWILPDKDKKGRNPKVFWMPTLGIVAGVLIILII